ncbi:MAG: outer membrane protein assembly factor BamD [Sphingomonadales bacterium]|nr:outer membrane protein assembly factor BamD [Sphingomonadales bacterium]
MSDNLRAMANEERDEAGADDDGAGEEAAEAASSGEGPFSAQGSEPPLPDDPGEAAYVRGYRLWRDGDYAAARTQLRETVEQFPGHRFESYARNLLGRAYLDDDKPASATEIFVRNYQQLPNGERAADSLFFLGVALTALNYKDRACLAFGELQEVYGGNIRSDIAEQLPAARTAAECD